MPRAASRERRESSLVPPPQLPGRAVVTPGRVGRPCECGHGARYGNVGEFVLGPRHERAQRGVSRPR